MQEAPPPIATRGPLKPQILIVDDHPLMLFALQRMLSAEFSQTDVHSIDSLTSALATLREQACDLLLLDLFLDNAQSDDPLKGLNAIRQEFRHLPIAIITGNDRPGLEQLTLSAGANAFISKSCSGQQICQTLMNLVPQLRHTVMSPASDALRGLSGRRLEVLNLLAQGKSNKEIALLLNISLNTVKSHVSMVLVSLRVSSRAKAVALIQQLDQDSPGWRTSLG